MVTKSERELEGVTKRLANLTPGNPQATGRTPNYLRLEHQDAHGQLVALMIEAIQAKREVPRWIVQALDVTGKYGMGAVSDVSLDKEQFLSRMASAMSEWSQSHEVEGSAMMQLYDMVVARLKDV